MRKLFAFLPVLLITLGSAFAQQTISGYAEVSHGWVQRPDGRIVNLKGLKIPYHGEVIEAKPMKEFTPDDYVIRQGDPGRNLQTIYRADAGSGYGYIENNPSSLDDIVLSGSGINKPWQELTLGVRIEASRSVLIRWQVFKTYVGGLGAGVSAFQQKIADFGVIFPSQAVNTYKLTFGIAQAGVTVNQTQCYLATQYREPNPNGQGAFDPAFSIVFNPIAPPTIGNSENSFYYDYDPVPDGIYDELEYEQIDGGLANFLLQIDTTSGSNQHTLNPVLMNLDMGSHISGDITDLYFSDDSYYRAGPSFTGSRQDPNIRIMVEGFAPQGTVQSMRFVCETATSVAGQTQRIELFNYQTQQWMLYDERTTTATDSVIEILIGNLPPQQFVHPSTRRVRARIGIFAAPTAPKSWNVRVDQAVWYVTL